MKKLIELTSEEMDEICKSSCKKGTSCLSEGPITCPLFKGRCMRGFIEDLQFVNKEVEL